MLSRKADVKGTEKIGNNHFSNIVFVDEENWDVLNRVVWGRNAVGRVSAGWDGR